MKKTDSLKKAESIFTKYLKDNGLKSTRERAVITGEILSNQSHFEADDIIFSLRSKNQKVSRGSIYRTLPLLVESGLIRKVIFTDKHYHYETTLSKSNHAHMICSLCGHIIEFNADEILKKIKIHSSRNKFTEISHKIEITGICSKCGSAKTGDRYGR